MNSKLLSAVLWIGLIAVIWYYVNDPGPYRPSQTRTWESFQADVQIGRVGAVRVDGNYVEVYPNDDGEPYSTLGVVDELALSEAGVRVSWGLDQSGRSSWPLLIGAVLFLVLIAQRLQKRGTTGGLLEMRRSKAREATDEATRFTDVGGCTEAKEGLRDVIDFLKHPDRWQGAGVRLPRAVLLEGPPGCGKTLLARAVAGEAGVPFFQVSGSDFVEMFVGVGAARMRDMFEEAEKSAPSVIFIDELDAVGRRRGSGIGASHDEREQTLNQLLVCLDGFQGQGRVVVIAATNRTDVLDPALLRPGRFDLRLEIPPLDQDQRVEVLGIHARNKKLAPDVDLADIAGRTEGWNGADLENLANDAGLNAVRRVRDNGGEPVITSQDLAAAAVPSQRRRKRFDMVDQLLIESSTQLAHPVGQARARFTLKNNECVEGELLWADSSVVKVRLADGGQELLLPKHQVLRVEALEGTDSANPDDLGQDPWAGQTPGLA